MKVSQAFTLCTIAVLTLAASATQIVSTRSNCVGGRRHTLTANVSTSGVKFVDLDGDLGNDLKSVVCDIDHTRMTLNFKSQIKRDAWWLKFKDFNDHIIVGGRHWNCGVEQGNGAVLRRVIGPNLFGPHTFSDTFEIKTTIAQYDEVFQDGDVAYSAVADPACAAQVDQKICLGFNADCAAHQAKQPLPLYTSPSTSFAQITATCTDCWTALEADVIFTLQFKSFRVNKFELGLRNVSVDAALVMQATADKQSTLSLDKVLNIVKAPSYLFDFKVGVVPFVAMYSIPVEVAAQLDFSAHASATFGATTKMSLGSLDISWDPTNHWQFLTPKIGFGFEPILTSSANLDIRGQTSITPTFNLNIDRIFTYNLNANPTLNAEIAGSKASKQLCLTTAFSVDLVESAELKLDINIIDFHKDYKWGPKTLVSYNAVPIPKKCINL